MAQTLDTLLNHRYEVRSPEPCKITDAAGIHICTAIPGCVGDFFGDGHPVTLSSDAAVMRELPLCPDFKPWKLHALEGAEVIVDLSDKHLYRGGVLSGLIVNATTVADDFFCELCFSSGATPTAFTAPANWNWSGEHVNMGAFVPQSNTRYRLVILSDGQFIRCTAQGISL